MKQLSNYQLEDFLQDPDFRRWVLAGAFNQSDSHWNQYLQKHPDKKKLAIKARELILATRLDEAPFPRDYFNDIEKYVISHISSPPKSRPRLALYGIAASIALLLAWSGWFWMQNRPVATVAKVEKSILTTAPAELLSKTNTTLSVIPVALPDGSSVLLHPNSHLDYRKTPEGARTVNLKGKAFFEVAPKGAEEPFRVLAGEMITHVLGTSFTITAFEDQQNFSVIVKTGEVAVNTVSRDTEKAKSITLKTNEQVSFIRENAHFIREAATLREIQNNTPAITYSYVFEDTPVTEVFRRIAKEYGLTVVMDEELLADCGLTTNLTREPLFQKLGIICSSIGPGTGFTIEGNRIHVYSEGCNL